MRKRETEILFMDPFVQKKELASSLPHGVLNSPFPSSQSFTFSWNVCVCHMTAIFWCMPLVFSKNLYNSKLLQYLCVNQGCSKAESKCLNINLPHVPLLWNVNRIFDQCGKKKTQNSLLEKNPFLFASMVSCV